MKSEFPRVITLLRKERGISQKQAAADLGVSQALLSHYEKGIRECGLGFLVKCADFYGVSCDYLLGRSAEPSGGTISVDEIPEPDSLGKENTLKGSVIPLLSKKLIANSMNILFAEVAKTGNKTVISEVSSFMMLAVYRMFRLVYSINPKNQSTLFAVDKALAQAYSGAAMAVSEANVAAMSGDTSAYSENAVLTTERMTEMYPLFTPSLLNLIKNSENKIADTIKSTK